MSQQIIFALIGTGFTFLGTILGASLVFFTKREPSAKLLKLCLGFAAGVMVAASIFGLIMPAVELSNSLGKLSFIPSMAGIVLGGLFVYVLDVLFTNPQKTQRSNLLLAVTLHNIPEGMAVGLAFAMAAGGTAALLPAIVMAVTMALQNLPEGTAISLPLLHAGYSKKKSFFSGVLSGAVEPVAAIIGVLLGGLTAAAMPWLLSFAAGAMMFVVFDELIPESHTKNHLGTLGAFAGFLLMLLFEIIL